VARKGRRAGVVGIEHQDLRGRHVVAVVPNVGDDDSAVVAGKIESYAPSGVIGRIDSNRDRVGELLARGRIGPFAGRHGQDLLAHDHEAVVEDAHHHDQEDGQNEGEFDEGLTLALPAADSQLLQKRETFHGALLTVSREIK